MILASAPMPDPRSLPLGNRLLRPRLYSVLIGLSHPCEPCSLALPSGTAGRGCRHASCLRSSPGCGRSVDAQLNYCSTQPQATAHSWASASYRIDWVVGAINDDCRQKRAMPSSDCLRHLAGLSSCSGCSALIASGRRRTDATPASGASVRSSSSGLELRRRLGPNP